MADIINNNGRGSRPMPPMPTPADFGITEEDWRVCHYTNYILDGQLRMKAKGAATKIAAYDRAVAAWERVNCASD